MVELEYQAAIMHGLRQLAVFQQAADLLVQPQPHSSSQDDIGALLARPDFASWFPHTAEGYGLHARLSDTAARPGSSGTTAPYGSHFSHSASSKSLPPQQVDDGGRNFQRDAVSEGDADSDQEPEIFADWGRHDRRRHKQQWQEELEAIATCHSQPSSTRPSSALADRKHRSTSAAAAEQLRSLRPSSASSSRNEASSRGASIPVCTIPGGGADQAVVPDRGEECGFGPPVQAILYQDHLDPSDVDSEGAAPSSRHFPAAGDEDEQELRSAREAAESAWIAGVAAEQDVQLDMVRGQKAYVRDIHERLDMVSERLRDGLLQPGRSMLRMALDMTASSNTSIEQAQEAQAAPSWVRPEEPPPGEQDVLRVQNLRGDSPGSQDTSEGSGGPGEALASNEPGGMRRRHSH